MVAIDNLLTVAGVAKAHAGTPVLTDVDLTVRRGEIIGVVGANGVGKSTLMSVLAGDYPAEAGEIVLNGRPYAPRSREDGRLAGVGLVRQHLVVEPGQTVAQALFRHTDLAERDGEELDRRAGRLLRSVGLDITPDTAMGDLLHTQQAIVEAVRMLAEDAQLVIMDEVAASFNADEIADLHFVVRRLTQQGRSIVYISHRLHEVVNLVDRIAVLRDGVITVELNPRRVTLEDLAAEMLSYEPGDPPDRTGHVGDDVAVEVAGLSTEHLADVGFTLQRGEVLGLVGPRTGGMRDVVAALAGRIPARFDVLRVNEADRSIASPEDAAGLRILYLGEDARSLGVDPDARVADVLDGLDAAELGITTSLDASAGTLSGGQLRRIALQRWATSDADLVLLVQPTRGLDVTSRPLVFEQLAAHTSAGHSAILVSTEADELRGWCDRIAIMRDGKIVDIVASARLDDPLLHRLMSERQGEVVIPAAPVAVPAGFGGWDDEPASGSTEAAEFDGWGDEAADVSPLGGEAGTAVSAPDDVSRTSAESPVSPVAPASSVSPVSPVSADSPVSAQSPVSSGSAASPSAVPASSPASRVSAGSPVSPTPVVSANSPASPVDAVSPVSAASPAPAGSEASAGLAESPATPSRGGTQMGAPAYGLGQSQQPWRQPQPAVQPWQPQQPSQPQQPAPQQPWQPVAAPAQPAPAPWTPPPTASASPAAGAPEQAEQPQSNPTQAGPTQPAQWQAPNQAQQPTEASGPAPQTWGVPSTPSPSTWSQPAPEPWGQPTPASWQPAAPTPQAAPGSSPTPAPVPPPAPQPPADAPQDERNEPTPEAQHRRGFWGWGRKNRGN